MTVKCKGCGNLVPVGDTIRYWPVDDPSDVHHVHRPDITTSCFRSEVREASVHAIGAGR